MYRRAEIGIRRIRETRVKIRASNKLDLMNESNLILLCVTTPGSIYFLPLESSKFPRHFSLSRDSVSGKSRFKHNDAHPIIGSNRRSVNRPYVRRRQRIPRDAGIVGPW